MTIVIILIKIWDS